MTEYLHNQSNRASQPIHVDYQQDINSRVETDGYQWGFTLWIPMWGLIGLGFALSGLLPFALFCGIYFIAHKFILHWFCERISWIYCNLWWLLLIGVLAFIAIISLTS